MKSYIQKEQLKSVKKQVKLRTRLFKAVSWTIFTLFTITVIGGAIAYLVIRFNGSEQWDLISKDFITIWNALIIPLASLQVPITVFTLVRNIAFFSQLFKKRKKEITAEATEFKNLVNKLINHNKTKFEINEPFAGFIRTKQWLYLSLPVSNTETDKHVILDELAILCTTKSQEIKLNYNANDPEFLEVKESLKDKKIAVDYKSKAIRMQLDNYKELLEYPQALIYCLRLMAEYLLAVKGGDLNEF